MLEDVQDESLDHYQEELDQQSGRCSCCCDYTDKDGQQVLIDINLLHPIVRRALGSVDEDVLPCELRSHFLSDYELIDHEEDGSDDGTPPLSSST